MCIVRLQGVRINYLINYFVKTKNMKNLKQKCAKWSRGDGVVPVKNTSFGRLTLESVESKSRYLTLFV